MKAIVYTALGPPEVLQLQERPRPVPKENQVLVRVQAASANALDARRFTAQLQDPPTIPVATRLMDGVLLNAVNTVLGADIAGRVEAVGTAVTQLQPGDAVFGIAAGSVGGFAEYACAAETALALKPANLSFAQAAAVPVAAVTALQALRDHGRVEPGHKVLIYGASGGVGTFAVQLARAFGAEVTAVCSTRNVALARALGADQVVDYTTDDVTTQGPRYDLILAVNGYRSIFAYRRALRPSGRYVALGGSIAQVLQGLVLGPVLSGSGGKRLGFMGIAKAQHTDLMRIGELLAAGTVAPVIERCYPLDQAAAAIWYVAAGHARGKVVITVAHDEAHGATAGRVPTSVQPPAE